MREEQGRLEMTKRCKLPGTYLDNMEIRGLEDEVTCRQSGGTIVDDDGGICGSTTVVGSIFGPDDPGPPRPEGRFLTLANLPILMFRDTYATSPIIRRLDRLNNSFGRQINEIV